MTAQFKTGDLKDLIGIDMLDERDEEEEEESLLLFKKATPKYSIFKKERLSKKSQDDTNIIPP